MTIQPTSPHLDDHQHSAGDPSPPTSWLTNLRIAYAALNDGDLAPIVAMLDQQVHLSGAEHGHLWWTSHRTWNGPAEVRAELLRRSSLDSSPRTKPPASGAAWAFHRHTGSAAPDAAKPVRAGEPSPMGRRFIVTYHAVIPPAHTPDRDQRHQRAAFHEVITIRAGKIVLLADYRSRRTAHTAANAAS
jgi:hypothetical protein